jgi:hypothetical protein
VVYISGGGAPTAGGGGTVHVNGLTLEPALLQTVTLDPTAGTLTVPGIASLSAGSLPLTVSTSGITVPLTRSFSVPVLNAAFYGIQLLAPATPIGSAPSWTIAFASPGGTSLSAVAELGGFFGDGPLLEATLSGGTSVSNPSLTVDQIHAEAGNVNFGQLFSAEPAVARIFGALPIQRITLDYSTATSDWEMNVQVEIPKLFEEACPAEFGSVNPRVTLGVGLYASSPSAIRLQPTYLSLGFNKLDCEIGPQPFVYLQRASIFVHFTPGFSLGGHIGVSLLPALSLLGGHELASLDGDLVGTPQSDGLWKMQVLNGTGALVTYPVAHFSAAWYAVNPLVPFPLPDMPASLDGQLTISVPGLSISGRVTGSETPPSTFLLSGAGSVVVLGQSLAHPALQISNSGISACGQPFVGPPLEVSLSFSGHLSFGVCTIPTAATASRGSRQPRLVPVRQARLRRQSGQLIDEIEVHGAHTAPRAAVRGPRGLSLASRATPSGWSFGDGISSLRDPRTRTTYFFLTPRKGRWHVRALAGAGAIRVSYDTPLPAPQVSIRVAVAGRRRALVWEARDLDGARIRFLETGAVVGKTVLVTGRARGRRLFTPVVRRSGRQAIEAMVNGLLVGSLRFNPGSVARPARPRGVRVRVTDHIASIHWRAVTSTIGYEISFTTSPRHRMGAIFPGPGTSSESVPIPAGVRLRSVDVVSLGVGVASRPASARPH